METGLNFIEFNYQLLQSYDYLQLFEKENCLLQIGGDDQWGNIVAGVDLIRRVKQGQAYGLTFPLVTTADGKKMGKTEKGALWLDPQLVSPYEFYQYWRNIADQDVKKTLLLYTFLPVEEIHELTKVSGASLNKAKEVLAYEFTKIVHGTPAAQEAQNGSQAAFSIQGGDRESMPSKGISSSELSKGLNLLDTLVSTGLCSSRSEARRLVEQGGAKVGDEKIQNVDFVLNQTHCDEQGDIILRAGKKRFFRLSVES